MILTGISISNFKSIDKVNFVVQKLKNSYTTILVGLNETGKSNLLDAISYEQKPNISLKFDDIKNLNSNEKYVDLYFDLAFDDTQSAIKILENNIVFSPKTKNIINLFIPSVRKNVYMGNDNEFKVIYDKSVDINKIIEEQCCYMPLVSSASGKIFEVRKIDELKDGEDKSFIPLTEENIKDILDKCFNTYLEANDLKVSVWKAEDKYIITKPVNLTEFSSNIETSIPLKNIFYIAGYDTIDKIKSAISGLANSGRNRSFLEKKLSSSVSEYLNRVWKEHPVNLDIRIEKDLTLEVLVKDKTDEFNSYNIKERSQGFRQFISLILSISISNEKNKLRNTIIVIDEPENHLHPSGIRYMRDELLKIGQNNYVFVATHSNFMIDKKEMKRHYIVKKDIHTNILQIEKEKDLSDDEILKDAFGISILKDFLSPHKILVEGMSDKQLLQKAIDKIDNTFCFNISNGKGDNICSISSILNMENIPVLVLLDDDSAGQRNKKEILKIKGVFNANNVKTIRDLNAEIIENGTIEDTLDENYIISSANKVLSTFKLKIKNDDINAPIMESIKAFLYKNNISNKVQITKILEDIKTNIAENFNPDTIEIKSPKLATLAKNIIQKCKSL